MLQVFKCSGRNGNRTRVFGIFVFMKCKTDVLPLSLFAHKERRRPDSNRNDYYSPGFQNWANVSILGTVAVQWINLSPTSAWLWIGMDRIELSAEDHESPMLPLHYIPMKVHTANWTRVYWVAASRLTIWPYEHWSPYRGIEPGSTRYKRVILPLNYKGILS